MDIFSQRKRFRLMSYILIFAMLFSSMPSFNIAKAEGEAEGEIPKLVGGFYEIATPEQLIWFSRLTNGEAKDAQGQPLERNIEANARLVKDIDMSNILNKDNHWKSIAKHVPTDDEEEEPKSYKGTFDGNGKTIKSMYMGEGAFIENNAGTVMKLTVTGIWDYETAKNPRSHNAVIAFTNSGHILACKTDVEVKSTESTDDSFAMIALYNYNGVIAYCTSKGSVKAGQNSYGITALGGVVYSCYSLTDNVSTGIFSGAEEESKLVNCYSKAYISSTNQQVMKYVFNNYRVTDTEEEPIVADDSFAPSKTKYRDENYQTVKKLTASMLGKDYVDSQGEENDGLPMLKWEKSGEYPELDKPLEGVKVVDIDKLNINKVEFKVDRMLNYAWFDPDAFTVKLKIEGEDEKTISSKSIMAYDNKVTIKFDAISEYLDGNDKKIKVTIIPASGIDLSKSLDIKGIKYWDDSPEEPKKIKNGDKRFPEYEGYYEIKSPGNLVWFAKLVNGKLEDKEKEVSARAFLSKDIDFNDVADFEKWDIGTTGLRPWRETIGTQEEGYTGIFDGNGHKIRGLFLIKDEKTPYISLFGKTRRADILNLDIEKSYYGSAKENTKVGGIASNAELETKVRNCHFNGKIDTDLTSEVAGIMIAGYRSGTVMASSSRGKLIGGKVSGIVAYSNDYGAVNCYSGAKLYGHTTFSIGEDTKSRNCYSYNKALCMIKNTFSGAENSYFLEGSIKYGRYPDLGSEYKNETESFKKGEAAKIAEKLGEEFVEDKYDVNGGMPILRTQVPSYYGKKHALSELNNHLDIDYYHKNSQEVKAIIAEYSEKIKAEEDAGKIRKLLNEAIAKLNNVKSDEDIKKDKNKEYFENEKKLKEAKEKRIQLEKALMEMMRKYRFISSFFKLKRANFIYTGRAIVPKVTVRSENGKLLKEKRDYKLIYPKSIRPAYWSVKVAGIGDYSGQKILRFKIVPRKVKISSLKAVKRDLFVNWRRLSEGSGYQLMYAKNYGFKAGKKLYVKSSNTVSKTLKKLPKGRRYYVKVRAYKATNAGKLYGAWSAVKSVKITK